MIESAVVVPFLSLAALRAEHARLLEARRSAGEKSAAFGDIRLFIRRGARLGVYLDIDSDRVAAQGLLDYWSNVLDRSGADYEDASLTDFDASALIAAADAAWAGWTPDEQAMAQRVIQAMARAGPPMTAAQSTSAGQIAGVSPPADLTGPRIAFIPLPRTELDTSDITPEASETLNRVLQRMIDAGWLAVRPGAEGQPAQLEVAQTALAQHWPPMMGWLTEIGDRLEKRNRLTLAAQQWQTLGRTPSALRRGEMLDIALSFSDLNPLEAEYVRESLEAERADALAHQAVQVRELEATRQLAEESRSRVVLEARRYGEVRRRNRALIGVVGLLILLLAGAIALALYGYRQSRLALARQLAVESISTPNLDLSLLLAAQARQVSGEAEEANSAVFRGVTSAAPELTAILHGHAGDVWSVAIDPKNPDRFATGGEDRTVLLWSAKARRTIAGMEPLKLERASVYALGFSPDGRRLAVGTGDGALTVFDVFGPAPIARSVITAHQGALFSLAFDPADPDLLLTGGQDRAVRLWDLRGDTPVLASEVISHAGWVWGVAFSPDGARAGSVGQGQTSNVFWWDVSASARTLTPRPAPSQHQATVTSIAFAPNGKNAVTGDTQGRVVNWDLAAMTSTPTQGAVGAFGFVWGLSYSADSTLLVAGGGGGGIRVWDVRDPARASRVRGRLDGHREGVLRLAFSPDPASKMLVSGSFENRALLWDLARPAVSAALSDGPASLGGGLNSAGGVVAFTDRGSAQIWDAAGKIGALPVLPASLKAAVSAAGLAAESRALGVGFEDGQVAVVDTGREWTILASTGISSAVTALALSRDGATVALAQCARAGSDGRCEQSRIAQRNTSTGAPAGPDILTDAGRLWSLAWGPDGQTLVAGVCARMSLGSCAQGGIRAWSLSGAPRELRAMSTQHGKQVTSLAFSLDGRWLASGSEDTTVSLWRVQGQGQYRAFGAPVSLHDAGIIGLSFDPTGMSMRSLARDRTIAEWTLDPVALQQRACSVANRSLDPEEWERFVPGEPYAPACR
ncbi:MAG: WD40 repeat domain-containing protein [Thermoflexales bacterium]